MPFLDQNEKKDMGKTEPLSTQELKKIFKKHDQNGDGRLDKDELKKAFEKLGAFVPKYRAWRGLKCADADGDGVITESEMAGLVHYSLQFAYAIK